jgi:peptidyl-prolyl cis-trans isomerase C/peptidyl-prolyl cis-trans isomerase D
MKKIFLPQVLAGVLISTQMTFASTEAARVNDRVITLEDVNSKLAEVARANPLNAPTKKQILDDLIKREAAIQEAKKLRLDQDPVVTERINNVLFFALLEKKLGADFERMTLSEAEAKGWYEKNPEIRTSHIFVALPPDATADDEAKASKKLANALSEIKSGKVSFAEAAQKYSEDPSSAMGGDLDYRMKDRLDSSFYKAAIKLGKVGDITNPIRTPFGMHLVRLTGKHPWVEVDRTRVKRLIIEERRQELVGRFLNDLRQKTKVSISDKSLKD